MSKISFSERHIPWLAELENAIFTSAGGHGELKNATDRVLENRGMENYSFPAPPWLQLRVLSLGYLILVFPKEYWKRIDSESSATLNDVLNFEENVLRNTDSNLRGLRNAFAHADISFQEKSFSYRINRNNTNSINVTFEEFSVILYRLVEHYKKSALSEEKTII